MTMTSKIAVGMAVCLGLAAPGHTPGQLFDNSKEFEVRVTNETGKSLWMTFYAAPGRNIKRAYGCVDAHSNRTFHTVPPGAYYYLIGVSGQPKGCAETPGSQHIEQSASSRDLLVFENRATGRIEAKIH